MLEGAFVIEIEKVEDSRGFFARTWDKKIFEERNLESNFVQFNTSYSVKKRNH